MTALIRQVRPVWAQIQRFERPVPPHAVMHSLLALGAGLLPMVLAILIHNVPEGLAVGAAYSGAALGVDTGGTTQAGASGGDK